MPNWIQGSLKLRGPYENVMAFFENGITAYKYGIDISLIPRDKTEWMTIEEWDDGLTEVSFHDANNWIYVNKTRRAFIDDDRQIYINKPEPVSEDDHPETIAAIGIRQAWDFRLEDWQMLSQEYGVDIRLFGIECGIGFWRDITIVSGQVMKDKLFGNFEDYSGFEWECPFPWMGG